MQILRETRDARVSDVGAVKEGKHVEEGHEGNEAAVEFVEDAGGFEGRVELVTLDGGIVVLIVFGGNEL